MTLDKPLVPNVTTRARGVTKQCHKMQLMGNLSPRRATGCYAPVGSREMKRRAESTQPYACAYWRGAHPRRHDVYGWKIRKGNFSFPVTGLRTKSSFCKVTRQCACVNKIHSATRMNLVWNFPARNNERQDKYLRLLDRLSPLGL